MPTQETIDAIRAASRTLVRELGFMGGNFAGTNLSPSAVHALIEIEAGGVTARDLCTRLCLEKSSVSRLLKKLVASGDVVECPSERDGRAKVLRLTDAGERRVRTIHKFARNGVAHALQKSSADQVSEIRNGLEAYAAALTSSDTGIYGSSYSIRPGYSPGLLARIIEMHMVYYSEFAQFGQAFEGVLAKGLADFIDRLDSSVNEVWHTAHKGRVRGSIAIDGEDLGCGIAHLRWFIVDDTLRGTGAGKALLDTALDFVDARDFRETHLWTFSGLDAARHLYETRGFRLAEERPGSQWGKEVLEQRFVRAAP